MTEDQNNGNIGKKQKDHRPWTKKDMDEAEPFPLPEIDDEGEPENSRKDKPGKGS
jgi:hypothetical protein